MTREKAKVLLPIIQAIIDGREIQVNLNGEWVDVDENHNCAFLPESYEYRVKPMITYRPFKDGDECWNEMQKHQPFAWVKEKHSDRYGLITEVNRLSIKVKEGCLFTDSVKYYTFADGTPFGVKVEE